MQQQGVEDIKGKTPLGGQPPNIRRKLSKAELREQALQHSLLGAKAIKPKTNSVPSLCKRPARTSAHSFALPPCGSVVLIRRVHLREYSVGGDANGSTVVYRRANSGIPSSARED
jgi:hypothetical protein